METTNIPTNGTPIEVSESKRKEDANKVLEFCDLTNSVLLDVKSILTGHLSSGIWNLGVFS